MYQLMVKRPFVAQHFLTVPNCGPENEWHSHSFVVEVVLEARELDRYGYLVDIDDVKRGMDQLLAYFKDYTLNELPEFAGLNPSIEHFARIFCEKLGDAIRTDHLDAITIRIWEDDMAWASFRKTYKSSGQAAG